MQARKRNGRLDHFYPLVSIIHYAIACLLFSERLVIPAFFHFQIILITINDEVYEGKEVTPYEPTTTKKQ